MTTINKQLCQSSRAKINEALKTLGEELGVVFEAGNCRFDEDVANWKLKMTAKRTDGKSSAEVDFEKNKWRHSGLSQVEFGEKFTTWNGKEYTVAGCAKRRQKYALYGKCPRTGKTFKFQIQDCTFENLTPGAGLDADLLQG